MPTMINGIGTSYCFARGSGRQGGDAIECIVILYIPIVPCLGPALHLFGQTSEGMTSSFQTIPIKKSIGLLLRVYLMYWSIVLLLVGLALGIFNTHWWLTEHNDERYLQFVRAGWTMVSLSILSYFFLLVTDKRNRRIRQVLGYHRYGNSDPATWTGFILSELPSSNEVFGTETYSSAVPLLLEKNDFQNAMWAARLSRAVEDRDTAERLTNEVLTATRKKS